MVARPTSPTCVCTAGYTTRACTPRMLVIVPAPASSSAHLELSYYKTLARPGASNTVGQTRQRRRRARRRLQDVDMSFPYEGRRCRKWRRLTAKVYSPRDADRLTLRGVWMHHYVTLDTALIRALGYARGDGRVAGRSHHWRAGVGGIPRQEVDEIGDRARHIAEVPQLPQACRAHPPAMGGGVVPRGL